MTNDADRLWNKYLLVAQGAEGIVFDPVSLGSASLTADEMKRIRDNEPQILAEMKQLGFTSEPPAAPQRDLIFDRINKLGMTGKPPRISGYRIVVTDRCNMTCTYCFVDTNTGADDITIPDRRPEWRDR
ncbi:hypothetical protein AB5J52_38020 [Streptomyces sp. R39]|uniref:Radical SAM protein n=1 Tax=Streptomyces sp. R39 TaxID=3238631 RepID=A0AB39QZN2_9ACTN